MEDWIKRDASSIWHPFTPLEGHTPIMVSSAEGVYLNTISGQRIIDAVSSWWVNLHGHSHPAIADAISLQARELEHVIFAGFTHRQAIELAERLLPLLPGSPGRIFFSDDGSTAVEVGLKMAMQYWYHHGKERPNIIALDGAYHGDTFGSMSVGDRGLFTRPWFPYLFDVEFIPFPFHGHETDTVDRFKQLIGGGRPSVFIFEPLVQAAAGMRMYSPEVLDELLGLCASHDVIAIADEVFTGFGRTGKLFACDYVRHQPDIVAISKGLTGGSLPLGITAANERILSTFRTSDLDKVFFHGHSFTGNPLSCAAANASLTLTLDPACARAIEMITGSHEQFSKVIEKHCAVTEVRTRGTIIAIELKSVDPTRYENEMRKDIYPFFLDRGILVRPLGNVLYLVPPYVITPEQLSQVYAAIRQFLDTLN